MNFDRMVIIMNNKKIVILIIVFTLCFALLGCGASNDSNLEFEATEQADSSDVEKESSQEHESFTDSDLVFEYNGASFVLDGDSSPLIEALGDDYEFEEAVSCAFSGMDKTFSYPGIDIYTYPLDGKDNIDEIYITTSDYKTKKGITVGSTLNDIETAYGDEYNFDDGYMLVIAPEGNANDTSDPCLYFIIEDAVVIEYSFYSASNRQ